MRTQQSIISIFSTEFVKQIKKFKVNVKGGFAVGFLDVFISEGAPEARVAIVRGNFSVVGSLEWGILGGF